MNGAFSTTEGGRGWIGRKARSSRGRIGRKTEHGDPIIRADE
jgi:hypothetical protein